MESVRERPVISVGHVIDSVSDEASGPSYSVPSLCEALARNGDQVRLFTILDDINGAAKFRPEKFKQDWKAVPILNKMRISRALHEALDRSAADLNVLHTHGLWLMANIYPAWVAQRRPRPLVVSPRGMLGREALQFSRYRKLAFWHAFQRSALKSTTCFHVTSNREYHDVRTVGLRQPIAIIPNGIDLPPPHNTKIADGSKTALFLGRIHPKKGVATLIEAWSRLESKFPDWHLKIVGPSANNDYAKELQRTIGVKKLARAQLSGPLYGASKSEAYATADIFILPTLDDNFAMTVAEALAHGTPVISTKGAPWEDLEKHGCGWWIDHGVSALTSALDHAMRIDGQRLAEMGQAGRAWMAREFSWNSAARSMDSVYRWLMGFGDRPSCITMA
jgi:glycosyltransferase involved in cell wall biosynthesis